jgi:hypothetical protein
MTTAQPFTSISSACRMMTHERPVLACDRRAMAAESGVAEENQFGEEADYCVVLI